MRAWEFISEARRRVGRINKDAYEVMPTGVKFAGTADRVYDLNRAMLHVAGNDGKRSEHPVDKESWIGRNNYAVAYTPEEQAMLDLAFKDLGLYRNYTIRGPSMEPPDTQTVSVFQGNQKKKKRG